MQNPVVFSTNIAITIGFHHAQAKINKNVNDDVW